MKFKYWLIAPLVLIGLSGYSDAQVWLSLLNSSQGIDWSQVGVPGGIPARTTVCASINASTFGSGSSDATAGIQSALNSCPSGQAVSLSAGTFLINTTLTVPSNVTLRGQGANQTILNAKGSSNGVVQLGSGGQPNPSQAIGINSGATNGSTSLVLSSASGVSVGSYLMITELNDSSFVTIAGSEGSCTWCDEFWSGTRARGQIVEVTSVSGTTVGIKPGLYGSYSHTPQAVPFQASKYAGVEDLQVFANNTGYNSNFYMSACAYCWIKGVEGNYADGDHVQDHWGYRDEIRDSYFSNAYTHAPGSHDSDVFIVDKTTATLVENNILERLHYSIILNWGAAGNVVAYNYMEGNFDANSQNALMANLSHHGAHPQFNLLEGNVGAQFYPDSVWGSSSDDTVFRNWMMGTTKVCSPLSGRGTVNCSGSNGWFAFQAARAMQISFIATRMHFLGNIVGSSEMTGLKMNGTGSAMPNVASVQWSAARNYDTTAYGWTFGYAELSDGGSYSGDSATAFTGALLHGNFNVADGSLAWLGSLTHTLPASFYLSGQPAWWSSSIPFPAIGPDVTGGSGPGGHAYGNPAENCYLVTMGGSEGGPNSPLAFNADSCYASGASGSPSGPPAAPTNLGAVVN